MYNNNKNQLIRLQEHLGNLDSQAKLTDLNRAKRIGLEIKLNPLRPILRRIFHRGVVTPNSSPPLNMPCPPQSSEANPFHCLSYHAQLFQWEKNWPIL